MLAFSRARRRRLAACFMVERLENRQMLTVLPAGFREDVVVTGLLHPTAMAIAPDGRIFVAQKGGAVRVIKDGALLPRRFTTVQTSTSYEYGLCGIALDPDFSSNGHVYLNYITKEGPTRGVIERFTASGDEAVVNSRTTIFELDAVNPPGPTGNYHVGGAMHFGIDGKLYISTGDNTNPADAQSLSNLHGKMLRINRDGTIPKDNPFFGMTTGKNRAIWAYGLRNAFTFAVQPGRGGILINDVGQNRFEEINVGRPGANYGWPLSEGPTSDPRFDAPLHAYAHRTTTKGAACIAGGVFYEPEKIAFPTPYVGQYFFADFNNNWMSVLDPQTGAVLPFAAELNSMTVDIDVGPDGALYYLAWGNGMSVSRISYTGDLRPAIASHPQPVTVAVGFEAKFTVSATGDGQLSYQWQRAAAGTSDFVDIPAETAATLSVKKLTLADSGSRYRVVVTNRHGAATSQPAAVTVVANAPPVVTILSPPSGTRFAGGDRVSFAASAIDPETGPLAAANLSWQVDMLHGAVSRPIVPRTVGSVGSFVVPDDTPYTRTDVILRVTVSANDPVSGIAGVASVDMLPRTSLVTLRSSPVGLVLGLEGEPRTTPVAVPSIVGFRRTISAAPFQVAAGGFQRLLGWGHGGAATQVVTVPATDVTYTATYVDSPIYVERFAVGDQGRFLPRSGSWTIDGAGGYRGAAVAGSEGVSIFAADVRLPDRFEIGSEIGPAATAGDGLLIFDVQGPDNFKYAGFRAPSGMIVAGRRSPLGWVDEVKVPHGLGSTSAAVAVRAVGTVITVTAGQRQVFVHDYREPLNDGGVGLATQGGEARFTRYFLRRGAEDREVYATATTIMENNPPGALVGILGMRGWGYGANFKYELVSGAGDADNAAFAVQGDRLLAVGRLDFERRASYSIRLRSTEAHGIVSERPLTITVADEPNEPLVVTAVAGPAAGTYRAGAALRFTVDLSRTASVRGRPELPFRLGGAARTAFYESGTDTNSLTFTYVVQAKDRAAVLTLGTAIRMPSRTSVRAGGIRLVNALPQPGAGFPNVNIDNVGPAQVGKLVVPASGTYRAGDILRFKVTFTEPVTVVGTPTIRLALGRASRTVVGAYESGTSTDTLTFAYRVTPADRMADGEWVTIMKEISLPQGAAIVDAAGNRARLALRIPTGIRIRFSA